MASLSEKSQGTLEQYRLGPRTAAASFPANGFGPFILVRDELIQDILVIASPDVAVHLSGCKGAGKTVLLRQIYEKLVSEADAYGIENTMVFFFVSVADIFPGSAASDALLELMNSKKKAYVLLDETQGSSMQGSALINLTKNTTQHNVTVIGAGISNADSISSRFGFTFTTERLFVLEQQLQDKGVLQFFCSNAPATMHGEIIALVKLVREYVGGHVYPLMRLSELLVPQILQQGKTADQAMKVLMTNDFRAGIQFQLVANRIRPPPPNDLRPLLYSVRDPATLTLLLKKGFCDQNGKIASHLLFDLYVQEMITGSVASRFGQDLEPGVEGVRQALAFAMPKLDWSAYVAHGGPIEDALTFEVLLIFRRIDKLRARLFNPKLINSGTAGRRPDMYLNNSINAYVEAVMTDGHTKSDIKLLEEHIKRFTAHPNPRCVIDGSDWAILHYQRQGSVPLKPTDQSLSGAIFYNRVFTFVMPTRQLFRGSNCLCG